LNQINQFYLTYFAYISLQVTISDVITQLMCNYYWLISFDNIISLINYTYIWTNSK